MGVLSIPSKIPDYRHGRDHDAFLTRGRDVFAAEWTRAGKPQPGAEWFQARLLSMLLAAFEPVDKAGIPLIADSAQPHTDQARVLLAAVSAQNDVLGAHLRSAWQDAAVTHSTSAQRQSNTLLTQSDLLGSQSPARQ